MAEALREQRPDRAGFLYERKPTMEKARTTPQTRVLIGGAMRRGHDARDAVEVFAAATVAALDAFDTDAAGYGLVDDAYHQFEKDSGVYALLQLATEIEDRLNELAEQRR